ncbi:MAG: CehA/McbA family metallohydrolase [Thermoflexales bacterium]|nr:CehA/McbA family metallohydrolase [Thermoflexales bacterium]
MSSIKDGPSSRFFWPLPFEGGVSPSELSGISEKMTAALPHAPGGECVSWGIPFTIGRLVPIQGEAITVTFSPTTAGWLVFLHTSDLCQIAPGPNGFWSPMRGEGQLAQLAANYVILYQDGTEERVAIRRRHHIGTFQRLWGENCFEAVAHHKPRPVRPPHEQLRSGWGWAQTRVDAADEPTWLNWLWAWENPHPDKIIAGVRFEPAPGGSSTSSVIVSAISAGNVSSFPLRWQTRRKAVLSLAVGESFQHELDEHGGLAQIQLDLGQVISATPRLVYPNETWGDTYNNQLPARSERDVLIEYTAHTEADFHLADGRTISVSDLAGASGRTQVTLPLQLVAPAAQRVTLRVVERQAGASRPVPVKLHIHGEWGEYLPPVDRHRIPNSAWFEDYSVDFVHGGTWGGSADTPHYCTYIPGETTLNLPQGKVYIEVARGFEIRPVRKVVDITPETQEIVLEIERVLPWRERGWVTADTHVHFLSPPSARLEGAAEGVNVVNLLASQWGELMTNVGDFDGATTWGSREAGGDGEHLVRVGTENRQHVLGHISLLGYSGRIIAPMTTGGPDESALGDPIEILLTEWARQCKQQGGVVVLPHFPQPRAEHAASIVDGSVDAVEMTALGNLYDGINPYSLSDWYRYLNCGYLVAAAGGTDKMSANTAVGAVRTYARLAPDLPFTYDAWMEAMRRAETFVTYGPLLEFMVDGRPMGSRFELSASGGRLDVSWQVASVTVPMSRVELVVNGEIRESLAVAPDQASGQWSVKVDKSCWLALLVRGHYADKPEIIAAHSSPVMVTVASAPLLAAADALTILEQIEGALAYLDTVGTRAEDAAYKRMRLVLTSAHRSLHNRMHERGYYHDHTPVTHHAAHG